MKKIKNLVGIFAVIFAIFSGMWREADFVGVADIIDDTLIEVGGEEFIVEPNDDGNTSKNPVANNGRIFIEKNFIDDNSFKISVYAEDVLSPVIGVSFHLKYDSKKIYFVKYEAGNFLESGGEPFYLVKDSPKKNTIYFGETLKKGDLFPTQGGKIVDFYFKISEYIMANQSDKDAENSKILFSFSNGDVSAMDNGAEKIENIKFENSEIDLMDKNGLYNNIASVFENFDLGNNKISFVIFFVIVIFVAVPLALFLAFRYGKKRAVGSVNFK